MGVDVQRLLDRLAEVVEARIEGMAQSNHDLDEASIASLTHHLTVMHGIERYIDDTLLIRTVNL